MPKTWVNAGREYTRDPDIPGTGDGLGPHYPDLAPNSLTLDLVEAPKRHIKEWHRGYTSDPRSPKEPAPTYRESVVGDIPPAGSRR